MVGLSGNNTGSVDEGIIGAGNVSDSDIIVNTPSTGAPFPTWLPGDATIVVPLSPSIGSVSLSQDPTTGSVTWTYTVDSDDPALDDLDDGETLDVTFTVRVTDQSFDGTNYTLPGGTVVAETFEVTITINGRNEVCFTRGTEIMTPSGPRMIEDLTAGDLIITRDNGEKPIRWISSAIVSKEYRRGNDNLEPIRIAKGALAPGVPETDLKVSPQHRLLISGSNCELLLGEANVLTSAKSLLNGDTIHHCGEDFETLEYWHMMFDDHEVVFANGCPVESFFFGDVAEGILNEEQTAEILTLFPDLKESRQQLAYPEAKQHEAALLIG